MTSGMRCLAAMSFSLVIQRPFDISVLTAEMISMAVPPKTVPAASLPSATTGTSPLLGGLVGGVVAPLASPSSRPGVLGGLYQA